MSSCAGLEPVAPESFTRSKVHCKASNRSVHDQVSKSGWVRCAKCRPTRISSRLRRILRRIARRKGSKSSFLLLRTKKKQDLVYADSGVISTVNPRF